MTSPPPVVNGQDQLQARKEQEELLKSQGAQVRDYVDGQWEKWASAHTAKRQRQSWGPTVFEQAQHAQAYWNASDKDRGMMDADPSTPPEVVETLQRQTQTSREMHEAKSIGAGWGIQLGELHGDAIWGTVLAGVEGASPVYGGALHVARQHVRDWITLNQKLPKPQRMAANPALIEQWMMQSVAEEFYRKEQEVTGGKHFARGVASLTGFVAGAPGRAMRVAGMLGKAAGGASRTAQLLLGGGGAAMAYGSYEAAIPLDDFEKQALFKMPEEQRAARELELRVKKLVMGVAIYPLFAAGGAVGAGLGKVAGALGRGIGKGAGEAGAKAGKVAQEVVKGAGAGAVISQAGAAEDIPLVREWTEDILGEDPGVRSALARAWMMTYDPDPDVDIDTDEYRKMLNEAWWAVGAEAAGGAMAFGAFHGLSAALAAGNMTLAQRKNAEILKDFNAKEASKNVDKEFADDPEFAAEFKKQTGLDQPEKVTEVELEPTAKEKTAAKETARSERIVEEEATREETKAEVPEGERARDLSRGVKEAEKKIKAAEERLEKDPLDPEADRELLFSREELEVKREREKAWKQSREEDFQRHSEALRDLQERREQGKSLKDYERPKSRQKPGEARAERTAVGRKPKKPLTGSQARAFQTTLKPGDSFILPGTETSQRMVVVSVGKDRVRVSFEGEKGDITLPTSALKGVDMATVQVAAPTETSAAKPPPKEKALRKPRVPQEAQEFTDADIGSPGHLRAPEALGGDALPLKLEKVGERWYATMARKEGGEPWFASGETPQEAIATLAQRTSRTFEPLKGSKFGQAAEKIQRELTEEAQADEAAGAATWRERHEKLKAKKAKEPTELEAVEKDLLEAGVEPIKQPQDEAARELQAEKDVLKRIAEEGEQAQTVPEGLFDKPPAPDAAARATAEVMSQADVMSQATAAVVAIKKFAAQFKDTGSDAARQLLDHSYKRLYELRDYPAYDKESKTEAAFKELNTEHENGGLKSKQGHIYQMLSGAAVFSTGAEGSAGLFGVALNPIAVFLGTEVLLSKVQPRGDLYGRLPPRSDPGYKAAKAALDARYAKRQGWMRKNLWSVARNLHPEVNQHMVGVFYADAVLMRKATDLVNRVLSRGIGRQVKDGSPESEAILRFVENRDSTTALAEVKKLGVEKNARAMVEFYDLFRVEHQRASQDHYRGMELLKQAAGLPVGPRTAQLRKNLEDAGNARLQRASEWGLENYHHHSFEAKGQTANGLVAGSAEIFPKGKPAGLKRRTKWADGWNRNLSEVLKSYATTHTRYIKNRHIDEALRPLLRGDLLPMGDPAMARRGEVYWDRQGREYTFVRRNLDGSVTMRRADQMRHGKGEDLVLSEKKASRLQRYKGGLYDVMEKAKSKEQFAHAIENFLNISTHPKTLKQALKQANGHLATFAALAAKASKVTTGVTGELVYAGMFGANPIAGTMNFLLGQHGAFMHGGAPIFAKAWGAYAQVLAYRKIPGFGKVTTEGKRLSDELAASGVQLTEGMDVLEPSVGGKLKTAYKAVKKVVYLPFNLPEKPNRAIAYFVGKMKHQAWAKANERHVTEADLQRAGQLSVQLTQEIYEGAMSPGLMRSGPTGFGRAIAMTQRWTHALPRNLAHAARYDPRYFIRIFTGAMLANYLSEEILGTSIDYQLGTPIAGDTPAHKVLGLDNLEESLVDWFGDEGAKIAKRFLFVPFLPNPTAFTSGAGQMTPSKVGGMTVMGSLAVALADIASSDDIRVREKAFGKLESFTPLGGRYVRYIRDALDNELVGTNKAGQETVRVRYAATLAQALLPWMTRTGAVRAEKTKDAALEKMFIPGLSLESKPISEGYQALGRSREERKGATDRRRSEWLMHYRALDKGDEEGAELHRAAAREAEEELGIPLRKSDHMRLARGVNEPPEVQRVLTTSSITDRIAMAIPLLKSARSTKTLDAVIDAIGDPRKATPAAMQRWTKALAEYQEPVK